MNIWRPYTQMKLSPALPLVQNARGSFLTLTDGSSVLDCISSWWVITHGHCHPLISEAIQKQAETLDQVIFANFSHQPAEELCELLSEVLPRDLSSFFFSDNGSTAVEVAMKMALQYCAHTEQFKKTQFLAFTSSYHGDTCGAMSVSGDSLFTKPYQKMRFEVVRAQQGRYLSDPGEVWLKDFKTILQDKADQLAAVILEPLVQGAAGMLVWPTVVVTEIANLCREAKVLLIFDEVLTGFGRTGSLFAFEQVGLTPDFICLSKGLTGGSLPLALTVCKNHIYDAFLSDDSKQMLFHGHSFTANSISCAAAVANLKIFSQESTLQKIKVINQTQQDCLKNFSRSEMIKDTRTIGAIGAIELLDQFGSYGSKLSQSLFSHCLQKGFFVRPMGTTIYMLPPYGTEPSNLAEAWDTVASYFKNNRRCP